MRRCADGLGNSAAWMILRPRSMWAIVFRVKRRSLASSSWDMSASIVLTVITTRNVLG